MKNEFSFEKYILLQSRKISRRWHLETHFEDIYQTMWEEYLHKKDKFKDDHYRLRMECWNAGRLYCINEVYGLKGTPNCSISNLIKNKDTLCFVPLEYIVGAHIIDERAENRELLKKIKEACNYKDNNKNKDKRKKMSYSDTLSTLMENANGESRTYLDANEYGSLSKATFSFRVKLLRNMLQENNLIL